MLKRRAFLKTIAGALGAQALHAPLAHAADFSAPDTSSHSLPEWQAGTLEIHHIDTGRGNAALAIFPDGSSLLIDAGEVQSAEKFLAPAYPDASRPAGEWIARYVERQLRRVGQTQLDTLLLTHLHGDHVGEVSPACPMSAHGAYRLTGAATVAERLKIGKVIDRGWPSYSYPTNQVDPSALNYIALARSLAQRGTRVECALAGSRTQIQLREPLSNSHFNVRVLSANGRVWTGSGDASTMRFPDAAASDRANLPNENMCSISLRIQHGNFSYYTGGDLCSDTDYGKYPWRDIETPVAQAAGPVSVAVANHHGYFDACGPAMVRSLRPHAWIVPTWHVTHPDLGVLSNLCSEELYPGKRLIFATGMADAARLVTDRFASRMASTTGHAMVRTSADGSSFDVHVLKTVNDQEQVVATFGPIAS